MQSTFTDALIRWHQETGLQEVQIAKMFGYHPSLINMYLNRKRRISLSAVQVFYKELPRNNPLKSVALMALKGEIPL